MNAVLFILAVCWIIRIIRNVLSYIHLWYIKEYRFDRMLIHLKSPQGKNIYILPYRHPPVRPKPVFLFLGTVVLLWLIPGSPIWRLLLADIVSFPAVSFLVFLTKIPSHFYHAYVIARAITKLRAHRPMTVIGITGSYGKTSTKEILRSLIEEKYAVLSTMESKNSPIAIAELVLAHLRSEHEVFIVEMGAYKKGEIEKMCQMVRPQIAIVTAINEQHQDLFGSIEKTIEAKYELVLNLTGRRIAIMNEDDVRVADMAVRAKKDGCTVIGYSVKSMKIRQTQRGIEFGSFSVRLFGAHQASNVLAASLAAKEAGLTITDIAKAVKNIRPFAHTMQPMKGVNGSLFIDDTFNNNPDAAIAALTYLSKQQGKKILVFQPMIELGTYALESHKKVAAYAKKVCDEIFLTNDSFSELFGTVLSAEATAQFIRKNVQKGDTVLFKGKEAGRVLQLLV